MKLWPLFFFAVTGCASLGRPSYSALPQSVTLRLGGRSGQVTQAQFQSHSRTKSFVDGQLTHDRQEIIDFTVETKVLDVDAQSVSTRVKTVQKDGTNDLHELAFPELGEEIDFVMRPTGEILKAGNNRPQSLFFVPTLPIPLEPVSVGDTWELEHAWVSAEQNLPLKLSVIGILKNLVYCEDGQLCADIEVSGGVSLAAFGLRSGARFESRIRGRILFSLSRGDVIWSEMLSLEEMGAGRERREVQSCVVSRVVGIVKDDSRPACEPGDKMVGKVPQL